MVSVAGANNVIPLIEQYNNIATAIAEAQAAVGAGMSIVNVEAAIVGTSNTLGASIPLTAKDTATVLNGLISIWQAMLDSLASQIEAVT